MTACNVVRNRDRCLARRLVEGLNLLLLSPVVGNVRGLVIARLQAWGSLHGSSR
jgi:hypothetical protein